MYSCSLENKYPDFKMLTMFFFLLKKIKIIVSTYLLAALGLCCSVGFSLVAASGGYSLGWGTGFSLRWLLLSQSMVSRAHGLP